MDARWAERAAAGALQGVVALPALMSLGVLAVAAGFTPDAIARGDHVTWARIPLGTCPGCALCGMSRALAALVHGDPLAAWHYNCGVFATGPLLVAVALVSIWGVWRIRRAPPRFFPDRVAPEAADKEIIRPCLNTR